MEKGREGDGKGKGTSFLVTVENGEYLTFYNSWKHSTSVVMMMIFWGYYTKWCTNHYFLVEGGYLIFSNNQKGRYLICYNTRLKIYILQEMMHPSPFHEEVAHFYNSQKWRYLICYNALFKTWIAWNNALITMWEEGGGVSTFYNSQKLG